MILGLTVSTDLSIATNTVTVNSQTAYRKGEYFRKELPVNNDSASLWTNMIVAATGQTSVTGNVFVAKTPEAFTYDADGNLTSDGRWTNRWDGENRLIGMETLSSVPTSGKKALGFSYDARSRRQSLVVSNWSGSTWTNVAAQTRRFMYDGWNLLAALDGNNALLQSFVWGLDLSGSGQGAGGVGGLLAVNDVANGVHLAVFDGNGNVMALVKGSDGTASANYEYGPFGELLRATGPTAKANPFRFSTKYQDDDTDLLYYGYRFYNSSIGRWLSRDPIEERGGINVYSFLANGPQNEVDLYGLCGDDDGVCGKDVTTPLHRVLDEINSRFDSWDRAKQDLACRHLVYSDLGAGNAWDIRELKLLGAEGLEGCDRQVTFKARCYYGSAANYAMFGRAIRKCHQAFPRHWRYSLDAAIAGVIYHKMHTRGGYYGNEEAMQAVPFTRYGWNYGSSTGDGPLSYNFTCAPDFTPDTRVFGWRWQPSKPNYDK